MSEPRFAEEGDRCQGVEYPIWQAMVVVVEQEIPRSQKPLRHFGPTAGRRDQEWISPLSSYFIHRTAAIS